MNIVVDLDSSSVPKKNISLPKLDRDDIKPHSERNHNLAAISFSNKRVKELVPNISHASYTPSAFESIKSSSPKLSDGVTMKGYHPTRFLRTKKLKQFSSSKRQKASTSKLNISLPKLDRDDSNLRDELASTRDPKSTELRTFRSTSTLKSLESSSPDVDNDATVKESDSTAGLGTKKIKKLVSSKQKSKKRNQSNICKICCRNFSSKRTLKSHSVVHEGLKRFLCAECGRSLASKGSLKRHILRKHIPEDTKHLSKESLCNICGQTFICTSHLNRHILSHEGLKPFVCADCGKSFARKDNMRSHILEVHFPHQRFHYAHYDCMYCNRRYLRQNSLCSHIKAQHSSVIIEGFR